MSRCLLWLRHCTRTAMAPPPAHGRTNGSNIHSLVATSNITAARLAIGHKLHPQRTLTATGQSGGALISRLPAALPTDASSTTSACSPCFACGRAVLIEHRTSAVRRIKRMHSRRPRPPTGPPRSPLAPLRVLTRPLSPPWLPGVIRTHEKPQQDRSAVMYYIVEITPQGIETFLEGFEEVGEAWDTVSHLRCEARRRRRRVRYEVP